MKFKLFYSGLKEQKCENPECGLTEWHGKPIPLQLHHINGIRDDNRIENLQILCPNCHAQTDTYCSKTVGIDKTLVETIPMVTEQEILSKVAEVGYSYKVAEFFEISESTLRRWIKSLNIRDKYNKEQEKWKKENKKKS